MSYKSMMFRSIGDGDFDWIILAVAAALMFTLTTVLNGQAGLDGVMSIEKSPAETTVSIPLE